MALGTPAPECRRWCAATATPSSRKPHDPKARGYASTARGGPRRFVRPTVRVANNPGPPSSF